MPHALRPCHPRRIRRRAMCAPIPSTSGSASPSYSRCAATSSSRVLRSMREHIVRSRCPRLPRGGVHQSIGEGLSLELARKTSMSACAPSLRLPSASARLTGFAERLLPAQAAVRRGPRCATGRHAAAGARTPRSDAQPAAPLVRAAHLSTQPMPYRATGHTPARTAPQSAGAMSKGSQPKRSRAKPETSHGVSSSK